VTEEAAAEAGIEEVVEAEEDNTVFLDISKTFSTSGSYRIQQFNNLEIQQLIYVTAKKIEAQEDAEGSYER
jgi:hypothetical protein